MPGLHHNTSQSAYSTRGTSTTHRQSLYLPFDSRSVAAANVNSPPPHALHTPCHGPPASSVRTVSRHTDSNRVSGGAGGGERVPRETEGRSISLRAPPVIERVSLVLLLLNHPASLPECRLLQRTFLLSSISGVGGRLKFMLRCKQRVNYEQILPVRTPNGQGVMQDGQTALTGREGE